MFLSGAGLLILFYWAKFLGCFLLRGVVLALSSLAGLVWSSLAFLSFAFFFFWTLFGLETFNLATLSSYAFDLELTLELLSLLKG